MNEVQRSYLGEVRRIVLSQIPVNQARVTLFGSWARDRVRQASDIDVAVDPGPDFDEGRIERLRESLDESTVPYRVDVVDLRSVTAGFRERVATEGIPWTG